MKLIVQPLKLMEILAFAWTGIKLFIIECRRYYYREETVVKTKSGLVKGFKIASSFDYSYFNFIGIPYAKAPIGELRFKVRFALYLIGTRIIELFFRIHNHLNRQVKLSISNSVAGDQWHAKLIC